mmetsp:Transcript_38895/g.116984  ORF Transcript_38895/g.116984 Transcript_38895/m.116984 type:complete len:121 (+) Transcript_38895:3206-3568(+)
MVWQVLKMPEQRSEKKPWAERFVELVQFKEDHGHTVRTVIIDGILAFAGCRTFFCLLIYGWNGSLDDLVPLTSILLSFRTGRTSALSTTWRLGSFAARTLQTDETGAEVIHDPRKGSKTH